MKKFYKLVACAALFAGFVFAGCKSNISDDSYYSSNNVSNDSSSTKTITIIATSEENGIEFTSDGRSARTILPDAIDSDGLDFYIGAKKRGETKYTFSPITFTPTDADNKFSGTVTATYELAAYEFRLYALKTGTTAPADTADYQAYASLAYFAGYASADLRYSSEIKFYLSSSTLSENSGSFVLEFISEWDIPAGFDVSARVLKQDTNEKVAPADTDSFSINPATFPGKIANTKANSNAMEKDNIATGTYNVVVTITNTTTSKSYVYSEKMSILPGRKTEGTVIVPDIIEYGPTRPSEFTVLYSTPDNTDKSYYNAIFMWTDTSYCERGFKLQLLLADKEDKFFVPPKDDKDWRTIIGTSGLSLGSENNTPSSTYWKDSFDTNILELDNDSFSDYVNAINDGIGTLNMNGDHVTIQLPLGHRFLARICAWNSVGKSDWTYLDLHAGTLAGVTKGDELKSTYVDESTGAYGADQKSQITNDTSALSGSLNGKKFDKDVATINQYKITYNLNGGTFKAASGSTTEMPALISYHSQKNKLDTDDTKILAAASDKSEFILAPNSKEAVSPASAIEVTKNSYIGNAGNNLTDVYLQLKNADYYWKKWTVNSITGSDYGVTATDYTIDSNTVSYDIPNLYSKYDNLQLFAIYTLDKEITAPVSIEDITAYELKKTDFIIQLKGASDVDKTSTYITPSGDPAVATLKSAEDDLVDTDANLLQISSDVLNIVIKKNTSCFAYDNMVLSITRNGDNVQIMEQPFAAGSGTSITIPVSTFQTGKYVIAITANTRQATKVTYRIATVFEIIQ